MRQRPPSADTYRDRVLQMVRRRVPCDHWVWGTGVAQQDGTMIIGHGSVSSLGQEFIDKYNESWRFVDVIGQMHIACPHLVQVWEVPVGPLRKPAAGRIANKQAQFVSRTTAEVAEYLRRKGIERVMLAGVNALEGRAWLTVYRTHLGRNRRSFTQGEGDFFRYQLPGILHKWLRLLHGHAAHHDVPEPQTPFAALVPYQLATLIHCAQRDTQHAGTALAKQFPGMKTKLTVRRGGDFQSGVKRVQSHVLYTRNAALSAIGLNMGDVRTLMTSGRLKRR